jgi:hypothetical protein
MKVIATAVMQQDPFQSPKDVGDSDSGVGLMTK